MTYNITLKKSGELLGERACETKDEAEAIVLGLQNNVGISFTLFVKDPELDKWTLEDHVIEIVNE